MPGRPTNAKIIDYCCTTVGVLAIGLLLSAIPFSRTTTQPSGLITYLNLKYQSKISADGGVLCRREDNSRSA